MWFFLIFCLIALAGFCYGRLSAKPATLIHPNLNKDYFIGLNYLLNDQNDKALHLLKKSLSVDSDTLETHLALGSLFRRRGELTRAIRIHQNLLARPNLTALEKNQVLLALAYDYLAAGFLDRAEQSFWSVTEDPALKEEAYHKLIDIYQRERRWLQAIEVGEQLIALGDKHIHQAIAHYYCERAQIALKQQQADLAIKELMLAKKHQPRLARLYLLLGDAYLLNNAPKKALQAYQTVPEVDSDYLSEAIPKLLSLYQQPPFNQQYLLYLEQSYAKWPQITLCIALANYYAKHQNNTIACQFLKTQMERQPSLQVLAQWIHYEQQTNQTETTQQQFALLQQLTSKLLQQQPSFRCHQCGFAGRILFWQCPGCKQWGSIKPIHGLINHG